MASSLTAKKSPTLEAFLESFSPAEDDLQTLFRASLTNRTVSARIAIASYLLDQGARADLIHGNNSSINVLINDRAVHDFEAEAPLLQRLIDEGADVNHIAHYGYRPILQTVYTEALSDEEREPFYRVLFDAPALRLDAPANAAMTVREQLLTLRIENLPALARHLGVEASH